MGFFSKKEKVSPSSNVDIKEESIRTSGAFVSLISHELRTPLTAIKWYIETLLEGEDAEKLTEVQKKHLKTIDDNNKRVLELIKVFSNVSKIESGNVGVDLEQVNIVSSLQGSLKHVDRLIKEKKIVVMEEYHNDSFVLFADKNLLNLVFNNLLSNAVKFSEDGGRITIQTQAVKKYFVTGGKKIENDGYVISFKNSGIGIPVECNEKIFSKMFRCDNAKKANIEGEGFGLFIVKAILDLTGGEIWFESAEEQGATFFVYLPEMGMRKVDNPKRLE